MTDTPLSAQEAPLTFVLKRGEAEEFSHALSDMLCWARGFMAGRPDDPSSHPLGTEEIRQLNILFKKKLREAR
jgi:hypothetical protein